jgi:cell filamentation protein
MDSSSPALGRERLIRGKLVTDTNGVYRNKLDITDAVELKRTEYDMTKVRSHEILSERVDLGVRGFGLARQQAIHEHLFQDVYE